MKEFPNLGFVSVGDVYTHTDTAVLKAVASEFEKGSKVIILKSVSRTDPNSGKRYPVVLASTNPKDVPSPARIGEEDVPGRIDAVEAGFRKYIFVRKQY